MFSDRSSCSPSYLCSYNCLVHSGSNNPQGGASHDPCITKGNAAKSSCHITYLTDVASQLSDFTDDPVEQSKRNEPIRPENDYNTHLQNSVVVGDNKDLEAARGFQFEFSSSNFTTKVNLLYCQSMQVHLTAYMYVYCMDAGIRFVCEFLHCTK